MENEDKIRDLLRHALLSMHPNWKPLFKANIGILRDALKAVVDDTPVEFITPSLNKIFKAFIINPNDVKVIIIGQDPYPKAGDANGLSFSTNAKTTPASLKNIFKCLNRLGYSTDSNNLMSWALQGVLLLNMALTTEIGNTKKHSTLWFPFITQVMSILTHLNKGKKMSILLWGSEAQKMQVHIRGKHSILKWSHPSPIADNQLIDDMKFINCNNFDNLKHIDWSTGGAIDIYTDGSGSPNADCASAVYIPNLLKLSLLVRPQMYEFDDSLSIHVTPSTDKVPTPQRAEYLAIIYALLISYKLDLNNVKIITDSRNAHGIITEWTKRQVEKYENSDLVIIMRHLYDLVKGHVELKLVPSHAKSDSPYNEGNAVADKLAYSHYKEANGNYDLKIEYHDIEISIN